MHRSTALLAVALFAFVTSVTRADVSSGPDAGQKVAALKVFDATGNHAGEALDYAGDRGDKPTVYLFIPSDKWGRPVARFLRDLDKQVGEHGKDLYVVAVWLTDNVDETKRYLPKAQMSIKLQHTALAVFEGDKSGPAEGWIVNTDADVTAVVAAKGKVIKSFGFVSANDTVVPKLWEVVKKATE